MARPTGIQSRARRIPIDIDDAIQAEAGRRGIGWAEELRRVYLTHPPPLSTGVLSPPTSARGTVTRNPADEQAMATGEASSVATKQGPAGRCACAKPTLSAASGMRVCTTCHLPRRP